VKIHERALLKDLQATAYRQAGHAVACIYLGLKFRYVTIRKTDETRARVQFGAAKKRDSEDIQASQYLSFRIRDPRHLIAGFAGQIAEHKFTGRRFIHLSDSDDRQVVNEAFHCWFSSNTTRAYLHYCWCVAEDLAGQRWKDVEAVATKLLEFRMLRENDVCQIVFRTALPQQTTLAPPNEVRSRVRFRGPRDQSGSLAT
jgi:hypothetical protein